MLFTLFIDNLLTDQHSSRSIKPHIMMFTVVDFLRKIVPTSTMQSVILRGESVEILFVPHFIITQPNKNKYAKNA